MEYTIPFNADSMAANIVDTLREITDATLSSCIVGAEETCRLLKEHIKSEELNDVLKALDRFEVDEVNCKDAKNLRSLTISIDQLCAQKEELSSLAHDVSPDLIEKVNEFCHILKKTDGKVVEYALKDMTVATGLYHVFIKEQCQQVCSSLAQGMTILCEYSKSIAAFLVESPLLMNVVSRLENSRADSLCDYHISLLNLIPAVLSSDFPPPIDIIQYLNKNLCSKLWRYTANGYNNALKTLSQIYRWRMDGMEEEEGVIQSLKLDSDPNIGAKLTEFNLRNPDQYQFELLEGIFNNKELVNAIFYKNDIPVLMHICCQHLLNEEDMNVKRSILKLFIAAGKNELTDTQTLMVVSGCDMTDPLVQDAYNAMNI
ncbi:hypothetical protein PRIPAC_82745 [Pristionchus pacificus]|uniref:Uncharacterized protein n=1 Tax=Pristionchus pacificus TaxID=54126 RepID=A0A8R1V5L9_PRIPA|nr:hypothetical protein PRIPAC_82745 [Pristionchus pacificus]